MNAQSITLNEMLSKEAVEQFTRLSKADADMRNIHIHIRKDYDGNVIIEYHIGEYGDVDKVHGRDLHDIVTEFLRRKGWTEANKPMPLIGQMTLNA